LLEKIFPCVVWTGSYAQHEKLRCDPNIFLSRQVAMIDQR